MNRSCHCIVWILLWWFSSVWTAILEYFSDKTSSDMVINTQLLNYQKYANSRFTCYQRTTCLWCMAVLLFILSFGFEELCLHYQCNPFGKTRHYRVTSLHWTQLRHCSLCMTRQIFVMTWRWDRPCLVFLVRSNTNVYLTCTVEWPVPSDTAALWDGRRYNSFYHIVELLM